MKETMMMQISLSHEETHDNGETYVSHMITWVEADPKVKKGARVKLKGDEKPDRWWLVEVVYQTPVPFRYIDHHGWDNNNYDKHDGTPLKDKVGKK